MTGVDEFVGNWTYRSFNNEPEIEAPADALLVAWGNLILEAEEGADCEISGQLLMGGWDFTLSGTTTPGDPPTIQLRASGIENTRTDGWIYDYIGYRVYSWPDGVAQRPTIVGSVIRVVPHEGAGGVIRETGETLSFVAVLRDSSDDS